MIHDLDIILSLVKSKVLDIKANGVAVVSSNIDIANARIEFENGCVANLISSRISMKTIRKMRIFEKNKYTNLNMQNGSIKEYQTYNTESCLENGNNIIKLEGEPNKFIRYRTPSITQYDALKKELEHFIYSIRNNSKPTTDGVSAIEALSLAIKIQNIINNQRNTF